MASSGGGWGNFFLCFFKGTHGLFGGGGGGGGGEHVPLRPLLGSGTVHFVNNIFLKPNFRVLILACLCWILKFNKAPVNKFISSLSVT